MDLTQNLKNIFNKHAWRPASLAGRGVTGVSACALPLSRLWPLAAPTCCNSASWLSRAAIRFSLSALFLPLLNN